MEYSPTSKASPVYQSNSNNLSPPSNRMPIKREWQEDDFQYESDPTELKFSEDTGESKQAAWLIKLPPYLAKHWKELLDFEDNEELVLGTIRVKVPKVPNNKQEMKLRLNPILKSSQNIPQDYQLKSRGNPHNMYCWAEEEKSIIKKQVGPPIPITFIERSNKRLRSSRTRTTQELKETTSQYPVKAVNKTSFITKFQDELLATPIRGENAPTLHAYSEVVKKELGYITSVNTQMNLLRPGTIGELPNWKTKELLFTAAAKPTSSRDPKDKAYRMNKDVLISSLYKLFEEKEYWVLKEFREKLFQPESFMKQVLREIAIYNQDGPMVGTWELNSDSKKALRLILLYFLILWLLPNSGNSTIYILQVH
ncbi:hypothetical protein C7212DRAFT_304052 [Tuber magnatum]|uniref:Transcription initiation factor IIF subunit beta n=1 Tax=Tuber magnatum TaxID=42249 RepID=A0A317T1B9_9PEZI|nr:hypothetical protein C7212DRAFT_304051 [Tuber magnatum]PWW79196.1 hypothetical protein C7212DRAFT_304052 [Tuber magnatum]